MRTSLPFRFGTYATLLGAASASCGQVLGIDPPTLDDMHSIGGAGGGSHTGRAGDGGEAAHADDGGLTLDAGVLGLSGAGGFGDAGIGGVANTDAGAAGSIFTAPGDSGAGGTSNNTPKRHPVGVLRDSGELLETRRRQVPLQPKVPRKVDLSAKFPPPGDQGEQQAGVAWASAYAIKSYQEGLGSTWSISNPRYQFSPAWVFNQIKTVDSLGREHGAYPSAALDLIVRSGCDTLRFFPYTSDAYSATPETASLQRAGRFKAAGWAAVSADVSAFKRLLTGGEAILVTLEVYPDLDDLAPTNPTFDSLSGSSRGRQAVVLIGYDDDRASFEFMNSWGTDWGLSGYGRISYDLIEQSELALDAYTLADSVNTPPSVDESIYALRREGASWIDADFGDTSPISTADLSGSACIAVARDGVYVIQDSWLRRINLTDGSVTTLGGPSWGGPSAIAAVGNKLYVVQDSSLFEVNPLSGAWTAFKVAHAGWPDTQALVGLAGWLYGLQADTLWRVDVGDGSATPVGTPAWAGFTGMAATNGSLYVTDGTTVGAVDAVTGFTTSLGGTGWTNINAIVARNGRVYIAAANGFWEVDLHSGESEAINTVAWEPSTRLTAVEPGP